jgi:hypothetical protein
MPNHDIAVCCKSAETTNISPTLPARVGFRYLSVEGHTDIAVSGARRELLRILNEETMRVGLDPSSRYSVV